MGSLNAQTYLGKCTIQHSKNPININQAIKKDLPQSSPKQWFSNLALHTL